MFSSTQGLSVIGGYSASQADPSPTQLKAPAHGGEALLPVTVRMIEKGIAARLDGAELHFHGREASAVLLVGAVEDLTRQQAALEFSLNDASGRIRARHFFPSAEDRLEQVKSGSYVSAVGIVKTEPSLHFSIVALRMVTSPDEISYHAIEVAHTALKLQQGPKVPASSISPMVAAGATPPAKSKLLEETAIPSLGATPMQTTTAQLSPPKEQLRGPRLKADVEEFLRQKGEGLAEGLALKAVCEHFQAAAAMEEIRKTINELLEDGLAYTTIDEDHFLLV